LRSERRAAAIIGGAGNQKGDGRVLGGMFRDLDESGASRVYTRTSQRLEVEWTGSSKLIMGGLADVVVGAILRVFGKLDEKKLVHAETLIILTNLAKITEPNKGKDQ